MAERKFQKKEWAVLVAGILILVMIGSKPIGSFMRKHKNSASQVVQARKNLQLAQDTRLTIESERSGKEALRAIINKRDPAFNLFTFTDKCLEDLELDARATLSNSGGRDTPGADAVNLTLKGVSMDELRNFLHRIYSSNNLIVLRRLGSLKPASDGKGLDLDVGFISPKPGS